MRRLQRNALRTRHVLERETQLLTEECRSVIERELRRTLEEYFVLSGEIQFKAVRSEQIEIVLQAKAESVLPFGIVRG